MAGHFGMLDRLTLSRVEDLLAQYPEVALAYVFGSQVEDHAGPQSDFDVAVLASRAPEPSALRARLTHELGALLGTNRIDVVMLDRAPVELAYSIIAQGKPIYQRDMFTRIEFEARVMGLYGDYLPVLRAWRGDILGGGEHAARVRRYREALGRTERAIGEIRATQDKAAG